MSWPYFLVGALASWFVYYATRPYRSSWRRLPLYWRGRRWALSARWPEVGPNPVGYGVRLFVSEGVFEPGWWCRGCTLDLLFLADVQVSYRWRVLELVPDAGTHSDSVTEGAAS